jgi:ferredoxin-NADP reductase
LYRTLSIREVLRATPRARVVRLDLSGHEFRYVAGQAVSIGAPGAALRRLYSIAAAPEDARRDGWLELLVGVEDRGEPGAPVTLAAGTRVDVEGPVGGFTFPAAPEERRFLFIAGGTGIAPLRAMLRHALTIPHVEIGLLYSARTPDEFAYGDELRSLARDGRILLRQTITRTAGANWTGGRGRIGRADLQPLVRDAATLCFACGPEPLVEQTARLLEDLGIPRRRIRAEQAAP